MLKDCAARIKKRYLLLVKFNSISFNKRLFSQSLDVFENHLGELLKDTGIHDQLQVNEIRILGDWIRATYF